MRRPCLTPLLAVLLGFASGPAAADCTCRAAGIVAHHGETVCLSTAAGQRLARCDMVLNNSSWTFLAEACPQASLDARIELAAGMSLPASNLPIR